MLQLEDFAAKIHEIREKTFTLLLFYHFDLSESL